MNEIARKLDFSLRRLVSALIIIYFFAAPFASTYASGAVTEVFQEGKKAATRKLTGKIIDKNTKILVSEVLRIWMVISISTFRGVRP